MQNNQKSRLLEVNNVTKRFPGVTALDKVSLDLNRGEVLALIGENGAGKSTLMKILGGIHRPDGGSISMDGERVTIDSVQTATELGIAFVHQELNLSDNLDIATNIFLGREPRKGKVIPFVNRQKLIRDTEKILQRIEMKCSPKTLVRDLSIGSRQMVEIAKALSIDARVLIMDEPTSSLSQREADLLFRVIWELREQGVSIIYISHRLGEIREVADRVLALRDGKISGHLERSQINRDNMVNLMVGRDIQKFYHQGHTPSSDPAMEVENLLVPAHPDKPINFKIFAGEILVFAGLVGAGRTELVQSIFGIDKPLGGSIKLNGNPIKINSPRDAIRAGIALVPEDRKKDGLVIDKPVEFNITLAGLGMPTCQKMKMIQFLRLIHICNDMVKKLSIRLHSLKQVAESLSGGNQQKVVLGKWLSMNPKVLLLDEPTRGIDVVAKEEIYRLLEQLALEGVAILVVSSEMQEVIGIADRILVMCEGRISGELRQKEEITEEAVVSLASGGG